MKTIQRLMFLALVGTLSFTSVACEKPETKETAETEKTEATEKEAPKAEEKKEEAKVEEPADDGTQWVSNDSYGVKFRVPTNWKVKTADKALSATSPDDKVTIILVGTESSGVFETAMGSISKEINLKEVKTEKTEMAMINGIAGFHGSGSAVLDNPEGGQEIQFMGYALKLDDEKGVAVMIFAEAEMYEARKEELDGIAKTIKRS